MNSVKIMLRAGVVVGLLAVLGGCAGYARIDTVSTGYVEGTDGLYAKLISIVDAKTQTEVKTDYRSARGERDVYAKKQLRALLGCGRRTNGIGTILSTRDLLVMMSEDAHMTYVPLMLDKPGLGQECTVLVNIEEPGGHFRVREFERKLFDTVEGREIYTYVPFKAPAPQAKESKTE